MKRYIGLLLAFLLLFKVFTCRLVDMDDIVVPERCPLVPVTDTISAGELDFFLEVWPEYVAKGYDKEISDKISFVSGLPSEKLPWRVRHFLNVRCWDVDRFYYVEQRIRSIIHALYLQQHTSAVIEILKNQRDEEKDKDRKAHFENMINMQKQVADIEAVSDAELDLIRGRERYIEEILSGVSI